MRLAGTFRLLMLLGGLLWGSSGVAQYFTPTIDGVIAPGEYGVHSNGFNQETNSTTWFMTWDANNLYLAYTGSNISEGGVIYLDYDPMVPVNGGTDTDGSLQGFYTYDRNHMMQPFRADFVMYFKDSYHEYRHADGAGYWGAQTANTLNLVSNGGALALEVAIPWNAVTNGGGRPASFNWFSFKVYDQGVAVNGVYHSVPVGNPNCACNSDPSTMYPTHYYNVLATNSTGSTAPFSVQSFTYYEDNSGPGGGYYLNGGTFYDVTINDNSTDNNDNATGNDLYNNLGVANRLLVDGTIAIEHDLYIGQGSALLPSDNTGPDVLATLVFAGGDGSIFNYGRLDPNPEVAGGNDWDRRRIDMVFTGNTTLQASSLFKDRFRFGNVSVANGAVLQGPSSDSANLELQWGTFDNNGTVLFGGSTGGHIDLGTRGDWSQQNDYFLNSSGGTGIWEVHGVLIGRNSSRLSPVSGGGVTRLQVFGDFENYDEFQGYAAGGRIDIVMKGTKRQYFRGNTTETSGGSTSFYNLEIHNDAGLITTNDIADVFFESFGGGTIDYYINGELNLVNGDLVTRDRTSGTVHSLILRDSATVNLVGASSNTGSGFSSFVDGPLQYEIESANSVTRNFPVGKSLLLGGTYLLGDFRQLALQLDHDAATRTTYTVEMFLQDQSTTYTWPSPIPETIVWISEQRYWNVSKSAGANLQSAQITLHYDEDERNDGVVAPGGLRILKDDGAGNWVNLNPLGPGGSGTGSGSITSQPFNSFSDFTLASTINNQPLPVGLLDFQARRLGETVLLNWNTATEVNLSHFEIMRSKDQVNWTNIGVVSAYGNTTALQSYRLIDSDPPELSPLIYYRLKSIDRDGSHTYSEIRTISMDATSPDVVIWPNPSNGVFHIETGESANAMLYDSRGKLVWKAHSASGNFILEKDLPQGIYLISVFIGNKSHHDKLIVR